MSDIAIVKPSADVDLFQQCNAVEEWAANIDDVGRLTDAKARLSALDQYLAETSTAGRAAVAATMRRLEVRIGELIGPAPTPGESGKRAKALVSEGRTAVRPSPLTGRQRREFREMAANAETVEETIATSDDTSPASRGKVVKAIRGARPGGSALDVTLRLGVERVATLDAYCAFRGWTRAQTVGKLIDRLQVSGRGTASGAKAKQAARPDGCRHTHAVVLNGGMKRCGACGATATPQGVWSRPSS